MKSTNRRRPVLPLEIKHQVERIFASHNLPLPKVLFRTEVRTRFLGESPANLLPSQRSEDDRRGWTVFFGFSSGVPELEGLDWIIAFPDSREQELPLQEKVRLGKTRKPDLKKAYLTRIPKRFVFDDLEDLDKRLAELG